LAGRNGSGRAAVADIALALPGDKIGRDRKGDLEILERRSMTEKAKWGELEIEVVFPAGDGVLDSSR
jgi:hypothetical protein